MSSKKNKGVVTTISSHTLDKIKIIEEYVDGWSRKILGFNGIPGQEPSKGVIYIDCMSNSGLYYDSDGNIIEGTAIRVAQKLNNIVSNYHGKKAILIFNDIEKERIEMLEKEIKSRNLTNIEVHYYNTDCNQLLRELDISGFKKSYNTLLVYDPYNASIDWDVITPYLNQWGEVIINHMVYDTNMNIAHTKNPAVIERYTQTYQNEIKDIIEKGTSKKELNRIILSIIDNRTKYSRYDHFIAYFPFFNDNNGLIYYLLHCCVNIEGIKLFKKTAWNVFGDKSSSKNTHGNEMQLSFDNPDIIDTITDEDCYYVKDIAKYVYEKYHAYKEVDWQVIRNDLDRHPVFPSKGYIRLIQKELKENYGVRFPKGQNIAQFEH